MDVSSIAASASAYHQANVQEQAANLTLKKSMDLQQANAMQLLDAVPPPPESAAADPDGTVGRHLDTYA